MINPGRRLLFEYRYFVSRTWVPLEPRVRWLDSPGVHFVKVLTCKHANMGLSPPRLQSVLSHVRV